MLDTNVLLDLWLFEDPRFSELAQGLVHQQFRWLATIQMREEFARVLRYEQLMAKAAQRGITPDSLLAHFDAHAHLCPVAAKAPYTCKDPDDQKFIDLAVEHRAVLYSKDKYVLALKNLLARLDIPVIGVA
ncbi:MAG: putative toxin-antitoxin system toxin component, PIN family [Alphaproteobacteria bacterium]|nr:putative toxin-antitoxin system toxin component, PIN family [Alphaproteobacteria bacterium]